MTDISVVVPMYNESANAKAVIHSIAAQTVAADVEILVCDDASDDGTAALLTYLSETNDTVRVLTNPTNIGIANTLARLTAAASGEYLIRVDGDTRLEPGALQALYTALEDGADLVFGHIGVWRPASIHERINDATRDPEDNPSWGGACVGVGLGTLRDTGGWTLRDGGHRNDETTELRRRAAANGWDTRYINITLAQTKLPGDWRGIAQRKYRNQWLRNIVDTDGGIDWPLVRSPAYWTALLVSVAVAMLTPWAWSVVAALGGGWTIYQSQRATAVVSHTGRITDIPLYIGYQLASGVLRTIGAYVGVLQWPRRYWGNGNQTTTGQKQ